MPITIEDIIQAFEDLGGEAHWAQVTKRVEVIATPPLPRDCGAVVRGRIQERSSDSSQYKHKQDLFSCVHGTSARKGIWKLREHLDDLDPQNNDSLCEQIEAYIEVADGKSRLRTHLRRERSSRLIKEFKNNIESFNCECCGFDFEEKYGDLGKGFIEAHHKIPVAELNGEVQITIKDLAALCSNCHRMIHRNDLISIDELKSLINNNGKF